MRLTWQVILPTSAQRQLDQLPDNVRDEVMEEILALEDDPLPEGNVALRGNRNLYRIRVARRYRVIYQISEREKRILIRRVRSRGNAYSGLESR